MRPKSGPDGIRHKRAMDIILTFCLAYLAIVAFMFISQRSFLYFPQGPRPSAEELGLTGTVTARVTPEPGLEISGWYWHGQDHLPVVVFFHGNGQAYPHWVEKLSNFRKQGYGVLLGDYRGYGGNPGKPSEQGLYADARAYMNWLRDNYNIAPQNMVLYGESLGSGVAVQMATEFPVKALILENPYSSLGDVGQSVYPWLPVKLLMTDQYQSRRKIRNLQMPKLFLHARHDEIIPLRFGQRLYAASPPPKTFVIIEEGGHNDLYDNGAALHVLEFLSNIAQLPSATQAPEALTKE